MKYKAKKFGSSISLGVVETSLDKASYEKILDTYIEESEKLVKKIEKIQPTHKKMSAVFTNNLKLPFLG